MELRLSPSRASDFKNCPQLFKFRVIDRLQEPPTRATLQGTLFHAILESLFKRPNEERTKALANDFVKPALDNLREEFLALPEVAQSSSEITQVEMEVEVFVREMLDAYFDLENPMECNTIACELRIEGQLNGTSVVGILDRLDLDENGSLVISDYKSGQAPRTRYRDSAFFALRVYAALIDKSPEYHSAPARLRLIYPRSNEILEMSVTSGVVRGAGLQMAAISNAISRAMAEELWPTNQGPLCDHCYFRPLCPAFAGA